MKKPIQVVMLPADPVRQSNPETPTYIDYLCLSGTKKPTLSIERAFAGMECTGEQYLYITVSQDVDTVKAGDFIIVSGSLYYYNPHQIENNTGVPSIAILLPEDRKITAANDPKLIKDTVIGQCNCMCHKPGVQMRHVMPCCYPETVKGVPQVPQSFLKEYVANPDGEWQVEYKVSGTLLGCINILKLNEDNTVTITPTKEKMYSQSEVDKILAEVFGMHYDMHKRGAFDFPTKEDWIKDEIKLFHLNNPELTG